MISRARVHACARKGVSIRSPLLDYAVVTQDAHYLAGRGAAFRQYSIGWVGNEAKPTSHQTSECELYCQKLTHL